MLQKLKPSKARQQALRRAQQQQAAVGQATEASASAAAPAPASLVDGEALLAEAAGAPELEALVPAPEVVLAIGDEGVQGGGTDSGNT